MAYFTKNDDNGRLILWDGEGNWLDCLGFNVTANKVANFIQAEVVSGLSLGTAAIVTSNVVFPTAYEYAVEDLQLTLANPTATDAVIDQVYYTNLTKTGFTLNVKVGTASATTTATVSVGWRAIGN